MHRSPTKTASSPLHNSEPDLTTGSTTELSEQNQRKRKRGDEAELHRIKSMVMEMKNMFSDFVRDQKHHNNKIDSLHSALEEIRCQNSQIQNQNDEIRTQNTHIQNSVQFLSDKYDDAILEINKLQSECQVNFITIKTLEQKVDFLERNLKAATIEIRNIPASNPETKESMTGLVEELGTIINLPVPPSEIKNVFRLRTKKEPMGALIVEFSSTSLKEKFLQSTKNYNKQNVQNRLNTSHLQAAGPHKPIYVSEALTSAAKRLHYLSREFIKSSQYQQCWTANGKVYVREKDGMPSRLIKSEEDLAKLRHEKTK